MGAPILEMRNITKEFPGVKALDNVSFTVAEGEIHGLVGENGAGKSTLMKVLSGVHAFGSYTGDILLHEEVQEYKHISESEKAGIAIIYQELALIPELPVYENIFLGQEISKGLAINWNETIKQTAAILKRVGLDINPSTKIKDLGVGQQQLVEIAKALHRNVSILILDEPTAALNEDDSANLLRLLREQREQGVTCILISHKLKEIIDVADTVTVLRDGQTICTLDASAGEVAEPALIKHMVGREIDNIYPPREHEISTEVAFEIKNWHAYDPRLGREILKDINFNVKKGEIVGLAGLMGAGRTELALSLFGNAAHYHISGEIFVKGEPIEFGHPHDALEAGLVYLTEDRKGDGLILIQDVKQNITLANLQEIAHHGRIDNNAEIKVANEYRRSLTIKTPSIEQLVSNLSGGNQQKVSLAKCLFVKPDILILDEPTRGIDVGAKYEIYTIMNRLVQEGMSIITISSELPEILGMSDRIYVVSGGRIVGEMPAAEATQENIMSLATDY
ncbi:MAG: sugar ABC transporter ATP-binding protein [Chloroflexota bacterium]|nr:sugar ABC transporter ATP-binding protein [Chloroflexota bacterium]